MKLKRRLKQASEAHALPNIAPGHRDAPFGNLWTKDQAKIKM